MLAILSTPDEVSTPSIAARAVTYPSSATRQSVANPLISQVSTTNPESWLQTLTKYVPSSINMNFQLEDRTASHHPIVESNRHTG